MFSLFIAHAVSYYLSNLFNIYSALICLMSHDCFLFLFCKAAGSKYCGGLDTNLLRNLQNTGTNLKLKKKKKTLNLFTWVVYRIKLISIYNSNSYK